MVKPWAFTFVGDGGEVSPHVTWHKYEHDTDKARATYLAKRTYGWAIKAGASLEVLDAPYKSGGAKTEEEQAAAGEVRKAAAAKAVETKAAKRAERDEAKAAAAAAEAERKRLDAEAIKRATASKGFDPDKHYGLERTCKVCGAFIEKTGKRGKPPATCVAHRDQTVTPKGEVRAKAPKVETPRPFGADCYPAACAGPGKAHGIKRTGERGRPPRYCDRKACQKAKAAEAAGKVKVAA
jgi:hypothetical protein